MRLIKRRFLSTAEAVRSATLIAKAGRTKVETFLAHSGLENLSIQRHVWTKRVSHVLPLEKLHIVINFTHTHAHARTQTHTCKKTDF